MGSLSNVATEPDMGMAYIGIGSNVDREKNIHAAVNKLSTLGTNIRISPVYESPAFGFDGDNFYNLVVGLDTEDSPQQLTEKLQHIENEQGRLRDVHTEQMDLPREDIESYAFVLFPLADIAAETVHPEKGVKIGVIRESFDISGSTIWQVKFDLETR